MNTDKELVIKQQVLNAIGGATQAVNALTGRYQCMVYRSGHWGKEEAYDDINQAKAYANKWLSKGTKVIDTTTGQIVMESPS